MASSLSRQAVAWEIPNPWPSRADVRAVPEPGQREDGLLPAGQGTRSVPRADLVAVLSQQPGHEQGELERDVKGGTIRQHAEPPGTGRTLARPLVLGLRVLRGISAYVRAPVQMGVTP